jgi:hypothetical protein
MGDNWQWWAGRSEEWMDLGSYQTRNDAIAGGLANVGQGEGDYVVLEAFALVPPPLDADTIINDYFEYLGDNSDYYSGEAGYPEWLLPTEQQKIAESELQSFLTAWSEKWLINNMNEPDQFGGTRNVETIRNTVDPDILPGGHDNPIDRSDHLTHP